MKRSIPSGHPIYQINRKLIVKEAVVQVAESENQEYMLLRIL